MSTTFEKRSIESIAEDYHALGQETADILNALRGQGEPLPITVERIAMLGGLPFESRKTQQLTDEGEIRQDLIIEVDLPNKGLTNRHWIQRPRLEVSEFLQRGVTTLLLANLEADAGEAYRPNSSWMPSLVLGTETTAQGLTIVPDMDSLQFTTERIWRDRSETAEKEFRVMDGLVNSLRGLIGRHQAR